MKKNLQNIRFMITTGVLFYLLCVLVPLFMPYSYSGMVGEAYEKLSWAHPFGTDAIGRDVLVRVCVATRMSIHIALFSVLCSLMIGVHYGCIAGYFRGTTNTVMTAMLDILDSIPDFLCAMLLMTFMNSFLSSTSGSVVGILITLVLTSWTSMARIIKNEVSVLMNENYIVYAQLKKASFFYIYWRHIIPNLKETILIITIQRTPAAIFLEAFLSFIGIGVQPPYPSLGKMISDGVTVFRRTPTLLLMPSLFLFLIVLMFNLVGNVLTKEK